MGEELGETEKMRRWVTMLVTTGLLVALKKDAVGFVAGLFCRWSYEMPVMLNRTKRREGIPRATFQRRIWIKSKA